VVLRNAYQSTFTERIWLATKGWEGACQYRDDYRRKIGNGYVRMEDNNKIDQNNTSEEDGDGDSEASANDKV
jgi:hypothetical protein